MPPEGIAGIILLCDGDNYRFTPDQHLIRAARLWRASGRLIRVAGPRPAGTSTT